MMPNLPKLFTNVKASYAAPSTLYSSKPRGVHESTPHILTLVQFLLSKDCGGSLLGWSLG